jgi:hypothetical protein
MLDTGVHIDVYRSVDERLLCGWVCITVRIDIAVMPATATNMMYPRYFCTSRCDVGTESKHTLMVNTRVNMLHISTRARVRFKETCGANLLRHEQIVAP